MTGLKNDPAAAARSGRGRRTDSSFTFGIGRGQQREMADSAEVKQLVAARPGMIGNIERDALDATVRAVLVVR